MMKTICVMMLLVLLCSCGNNGGGTGGGTTPPSTVATRKALIVGINTYPGAPLEGCVNDANDMKDYIIKNYNYKDEEIKVLLNDKAKTSDILDGLKWLIDGAKAGDQRIFHYSGHGAEFAGSTAGQPDDLNQVICPYDFDWSPQHMIMDVQFTKMFGGMANGVVFNWISDSCHSGDLTKEIPKNPKLKIVARSWPNVPEIISDNVKKAKSANKKSKGFVGGILDVGFVSGCRFDQTSADTQDETGRPCGALTHYFLVTLDKNKDKDLKFVVETARQLLTNLGYSQEPQAEGARINKPFQN